MYIYNIKTKLNQYYTDFHLFSQKTYIHSHKKPMLTVKKKPTLILTKNLHSLSQKTYTHSQKYQKVHGDVQLKYKSTVV